MSTATKPRTNVESPPEEMSSARVSSPVLKKVSKPAVVEEPGVRDNDDEPASEEKAAPSDWVSLTIILLVFVLATLLMAWLASFGPSEPVEPIYFFPMM